MKKILWITALVAMSGSALAAEDNGFFASVGVSRLDIDLSDGTFKNSGGEFVSGSSLNIDFDNAPMVSLTAGYNWGGWALELAYEHTLKSGDMSVGSAKGEFDYRNYRLGGAYRSSGQLYFLGKFGLANPELDTAIPGTKFRLGRMPSFVGLGGGYRLGPSSSVEFDYSRTSGDTGSFTLGWRQHF